MLNSNTDKLLDDLLSTSEPAPQEDLSIDDALDTALGVQSAPSITMKDKPEPSEAPPDVEKEFGSTQEWKLTGGADATVELGFGSARVDTGLKWSSIADFFSDDDVEEVATPSGTELVKDDNTASLMAGVVGLGRGMQSTTKGVAQILGLDEESWKQDDKYMAELQDDPVYGGNFTVGEVTGVFVDPAAMIAAAGVLKAGKLLSTTTTVAKALTRAKQANTIVQGGLKGAAGASAWGAVSYVDEEQNQTRIGNTLVAGAFGGVLGVGGAKLSAMADLKKANLIEQQAINTVQEYKDRVAQVMISKGYDGRKTMLAVRQVNKEAPELAQEAKALATTRGIKWNWKDALNDYKIKASTDSGLFTTTVNPVRVNINGSSKAQTPSAVDKYIASTYYAIGTIDKKLMGRQYQYEANIHTIPAKYIKQRTPFADYFPSTKDRTQLDKSLVQFTTEQSRQLKQWLLTGKFDEARTFLKGTRGDHAVKAFDDTIVMLNELKDQQVKYGILDKTVDNYWPRVVKRESAPDFLAKFKKDFGTPDDIAKKIDAANARMLDKEGRSMSAAETMQWLQRNYFGDEQTITVFGARVQRKVKNIKDDMLDYYEDPIASLDSYIHSAVKEVEMARLLGGGDDAAAKIAYTNGIRVGTSGDDVIDNGVFDVEKALVSSNIFDGLDDSQKGALVSLYKARFGSAEQSIPAGLRRYKAIANIALLYNPVSAAKQAGDIANSYYKFGVVSSTKALAKSIVRADSRITLEDLGLERFRYTEMEDASNSLSTEAQDVFAKYSGWNFMDRLGKETISNAVLDRSIKYATGKSLDKHSMKRWESTLRETYGDAQFAVLKKELQGFQKGDIPSDNMMTHVFSELAGVQPITRSNMPPEYHKMRYGKALYTMKSYVLTQVELQRKDIVNDLFSKHTSVEDKVRAFGRAGKYIAVLGAAGIGQQQLVASLTGDSSKSPFDGMDEMSQASVSIELARQAGLYSMYKPLGITDYTIDKILTGDIASAVGDVVLPPSLGLVTVGKEAMAAAGGTQEWTQAGARVYEKESRMVPMVGPFLKSNYAPGVYDARDPSTFEEPLEFSDTPKEKRALEWK